MLFSCSIVCNLWRSARLTLQDSRTCAGLRWGRALPLGAHARAAGRPQKRNTAKGQRAKENRSAEKASAVVGAEGDGEWEKALSLINFGFSRPAGSDLSKFKSVLFSAKAKGVPVAAPSQPRPGLLGGLI
jgi:hypothetical protein